MAAQKQVQGAKQAGHVASMYPGSVFQEFQDVLRSQNYVEFDDVLSMV